METVKQMKVYNFRTGSYLYNTTEPNMDAPEVIPTGSCSSGPTANHQFFVTQPNITFRDRLDIFLTQSMNPHVEFRPAAENRPSFLKRLFTAFS